MSENNYSVYVSCAGRTRPIQYSGLDEITATKMQKDILDAKGEFIELPKNKGNKKDMNRIFSLRRDKINWVEVTTATPEEE